MEYIKQVKTFQFIQHIVIIHSIHWTIHTAMTANLISNKTKNQPCWCWNRIKLTKILQTILNPSSEFFIFWWQIKIIHQTICIIHSAVKNRPQLHQIELKSNHFTAGTEETSMDTPRHVKISHFASAQRNHSPDAHKIIHSCLKYKSNQYKRIHEISYSIYRDIPPTKKFPTKKKKTKANNVTVIKHQTTGNPSDRFIILPETHKKELFNYI